MKKAVSVLLLVVMLFFLIIPPVFALSEYDIEKIIGLRVSAGTYRANISREESNLYLIHENGNSSSASFFFDRGNTLLDRQEYDSAIADFTEAIRLNPNYAAAYNNRGVAYYRKGDIDKAIAGYEAALRIDPNFTLARNNLENARQTQWDDDMPPPGDFIIDDPGGPLPDDVPAR